MNARHLCIPLGLQLLTGCIIATTDPSDDDATATSGRASDGGTSRGSDDGRAPTADGSSSAGDGTGAVDDDAGTSDGAVDGCHYFDDICADSDFPQTDCAVPVLCPVVFVLSSEDRFGSVVDDRDAADCVLAALRDDAPGFHTIVYSFDEGPDSTVTLQTMGNGSVITHLAEADGDCLDVIESWEPLRSLAFFDNCLLLDDAELVDSACLVEPGDPDLCPGLDVNLSCR